MLAPEFDEPRPSERNMVNVDRSTPTALLPTAYGYYDEQTREYVITRPDVPTP